MNLGIKETWMQRQQEVNREFGQRMHKNPSKRIKLQHNAASATFNNLTMAQTVTAKINSCYVISVL